MTEITILRQLKQTCRQSPDTPIGNNWMLFLHALSLSNLPCEEIETRIAQARAEQHGITDLMDRFQRVRESHPRLMKKVRNALTTNNIRETNRLLLGPVHKALTEEEVDSTIFVG